MVEELINAEEELNGAELNLFILEILLRLDWRRLTPVMRSKIKKNITQLGGKNFQSTT